MKKLKLNKESLQRLDEKKMSEIRGGVAFLSLWGSNCYATDPTRHKCCRTGTLLDPECQSAWSCSEVCDITLMPWGDAHQLANGALEYLNDDGIPIVDPNFDPGNSPYFIVD